MAQLRTHIDLNEVEASPWACGPATRKALVDAARALIAIVEAEGWERWYDPDEYNEPWASALRAVQPFRAETPATMPEGVTEVDPW